MTHAHRHAADRAVGNGVGIRTDHQGARVGKPPFWKNQVGDAFAGEKFVIPCTFIQARDSI